MALLAPVRGHGRGLAQRAGHRARRGRLGLRRRRHAATSTRTASLWYANLGHGRTEIADAVAAQMRSIEAYHTFGDFGNRPANELCERARGARADARRQGLPHQRRRRLDRGRGQARPPPLRQPRPARARAPDLAHPGLPRHARLRHLARRHRGQRRPTGARWSRRRRRVPYDSLPALEEEIRRVGPDKVAAFFCEPVIGAGGVLLAARRLHPGRRRPVRRARHPARHRRRDLRLRPARHVVRRRALGGRQPGHDHVRQGRHERLPAARRRRRRRARRGAVLRRSRRPDVPPRRHLRRPPDGLRGGARDARHLRGART